MAVLPVYKLSHQELSTAYQKLGELVAIPSVSDPSSPDHSIKNMQRIADKISKELRDIHFSAEQISIDDSSPFILANNGHDPHKLTVLFYAHYDVQPVDPSEWKSPPFVLTERDHRLYGRGSSDDKGGIIAIITALGAYQKTYGFLPVNVKILFEGEEEIDSSHMETLIAQERQKLQADALVVLDSDNASVDAGTLTYSTRGLVNLHLTIQTMKQAVHSGDGCLLPDVSQALAKIMTKLSDPKALPHFMDDCEQIKPEERKFLKERSETADEYAKKYQLLAGAQLRGDKKNSIYERVTEEPSISFTNGGWGMPNGGNSIQPQAWCDIGIRITAGQDPMRISQLLTDYIQDQFADSGYQVTVEQKDKDHAWKGDLTKPLTKQYMEALGENFRQTHVQPTGGTIPLLWTFQQHFPKMEIIVPGVADPQSAYHSKNESQDLGVFEKAANSIISFIHRIGKV